MSEFSIIHALLEKMNVVRNDVVMGSGDDCAILEIPFGKQLIVSTDSLVSGRHFPFDTNPFAVGYKSLAVNLSDIAAMGGTPSWCSLSLTLPDNNQTWLNNFADGFSKLASEFDLQLVGGDITKGPLTITVTIHGFVEKGHAILRSGAVVGDDVYVSGSLGSAAYTLSQLPSGGERTPLDYPYPRVKLGQALSHVASSCIDVSDGVLADLKHILKKSRVGANINWQDIPHNLPAELELEKLYQYVLAGGDDYELLFTAPKDKRSHIQEMAQQQNLALSRIGEINDHVGQINVLDRGKEREVSGIVGFDHFL